MEPQMVDSKRTSSASATALAQILGTSAVDVEIDGKRLSLAISVDGAELERRQAASMGAVTSTGTLHGLWLLPYGGTVPELDVPPHKRDRFRSEPGWVRKGPGGLQRLYSPAGVVTAAAVTRARSVEALRIASALPPIMERYVVLNEPSKELTADARKAGVGVIANGAEPRIVAEPQECVTGRPAVYRWWIAEIAYEQWLQLNAQPVS